jgi:hypothetical protein
VVNRLTHAQQLRPNVCSRGRKIDRSESDAVPLDDRSLINLVSDGRVQEQPAGRIREHIATPSL